MNRLSPNSGFRFTPQSPNIEILEKLKDHEAKWSLTSKNKKFTVKFDKQTADFETLDEAINWLKEQFKNVGIKA